jgi:hypothetical protein
LAKAEATFQIKIQKYMKKTISCLLFMAFAIYTATAQEEKEKPIFKIDLEKGLVNGLSPTTSMDSLKKLLPFYTSDTAENPDYNCGGGVFYLNNDVYFYTGRDYIEIRTEFNGKLSHDVLNRNIQEVTRQLGKPDDQIKPGGDDESIMVVYFKRPYGCLRLNYTISTGNIYEIGIHMKPILDAKMDICF